MCKRLCIPFLLAIIVFMYIGTAQTTIQAGITNDGPILSVWAKASDAIAGENVSGVLVTITWDDAYGVELGTIDNTPGFGFFKAGAGTIGGFDYQIFAAVPLPPVDITWRAGGVVKLFSVPVNQTGDGTGTFSLAANGFGVNTDWWIEISGDDVNWTNTADPYFTESVDDVPLPVELTSLTASVERFTVSLNWETATEIENYGFSVQRARGKEHGAAKPHAPGAIQWEEIGFVEGHGTVNTPKSYSFTDEVEISGRYSYRLKQIDLDGTYRYYGPVDVMVGGVEAKFYLSDSYPNPANPSARIEFVLEERGYATLKVYNILGQYVATLVNEELTAGQIHRVTFDGSRLSSGTYIYVLRSGEKVEVKRLLLMK